MGAEATQQRRDWPKEVLRGGGFTATIWVAATAGFAMFGSGTSQTQYPFVYGVGVALLLLYPRRALIPLVLGAALGGITAGRPVGAALLSGGLAAAQAGAGAWLVGRLAGGPAFLATLLHFGRFVFYAGLLVPFVWLVAESLAGGRAPDLAAPGWAQCWLAPGVSAVVLAPLVVLGIRQPPGWWNYKKIRECAVVTVALVASAAYAFTGSSGVTPLRIVTAYLPTALVVAAALRFSPRETALLAGLLGAVVLVGARRGGGVFTALPAGYSLMAAEVFVMMTALVGMTTAIVVSQRQRAQEELRRLNQVLESRVAERTAQLEADNAARRAAETALQRSESLRRRAEAFARTMLVRLDLDGRFLEAPPALCELLGYSEAELRAMSCLAVTHPEDWARAEAMLEHLRLGRRRNLEDEHRCQTRDGRVVWVLLDATGVFDEAGQPVEILVYLRDITRQKAAEAALEAARAELEHRVAERTAALRRANEVLTREIAQRKLAEASHLQALSRLVDLQETERANVARELHDQLGQELNALNLGLNLLRHYLNDPEVLNAEIQRLSELASRLVQAMHRMAWDLRPPALDDFGLDVALQRYSMEWSQRARIPIKFHSQNMGIERLPLRVETALYRVAQEALSNVYFHARARTVSLLLQRREDAVALIVEDDGRGFDYEALSRNGDIRKRLGLVGMQERMLLIGGSLTVESHPGEGTTILATVPLPVPEALPA